MRPRLLSVALLAGLGLTACAPAPVAVTVAKTELGFRRLVEAGTALVGGTVKVPAALLRKQASLLDVQTTDGPARLNEMPVAGATVTVVDAAGVPVPAIAPAKTDEQGRYALRGLQPGRIYYVQAAIETEAGARRVFQTFVKPTGAQVCAGIDMASTLVALSLQAEKPENVATDKLDSVLAVAKDRLPALLDQQNGHAADLGGALEGLLNDLTQAPGAGARAAAAKLLENEPLLKQAVQEATSSSLEVNFTIQGTGVNSAPLLTAERIGNPMSGRIEFVCRIEGEAYDRVAFWLNNDRIAEAAWAPSGWVAQLDTTAHEDGAYMLTVVADGEGAAPLQFKTFVYIDNTQPHGLSSCGD